MIKQFESVLLGVLLSATGLSSVSGFSSVPSLFPVTVRSSFGASTRKTALYLNANGDSDLSVTQGPASSSSTSLNAAVVSDEFEAGEKLNMNSRSSSQVAENEVDKSPKSYLDDGFIFGLEGSGLERPKGKVSQVVVVGDTLATQPYQVAIVVATFLGHSLFAANAVSEIFTATGGDALSTTTQVLSVLLASWVLADFGSGVLHWSVDNYGNGRTPVMGNIIAAFQGHHSAPWTITERGFCNNVYKLCTPFGIPTMALINHFTDSTTTLFFTAFCALEILSQEFHKWSHMTPKECPQWVNALQSAGLTIDRRSHAQHHMAPFDGNYSIISGICNKPLDGMGFYRRLEHIVYKINGVESNAWKLDPELRARTLRGEYRQEL